MESSADSNHDYRYKIGDRVVLFTKKGVPIHGIVKWVGIYRFTINKTDCSYKSVGIETVSKIVPAFLWGTMHFIFRM